MASNSTAESSATCTLDNIPQDIWIAVIIPYLGHKCIRLDPDSKATCIDTINLMGVSEFLCEIICNEQSQFEKLRHTIDRTSPLVSAFFTPGLPSTIHHHVKGELRWESLKDLMKTVRTADQTNATEAREVGKVIARVQRHCRYFSHLWPDTNVEMVTRADVAKKAREAFAASILAAFPCGGTLHVNKSDVMACFESPTLRTKIREQAGRALICRYIYQGRRSAEWIGGVHRGDLVRLLRKDKQSSVPIKTHQFAYSTLTAMGVRFWKKDGEWDYK
jgi:hypothetical protein